jgi:hypothetical protein
MLSKDFYSLRIMVFNICNLRFGLKHLNGSPFANCLHLKNTCFLLYCSVRLLIFMRACGIATVRVLTSCRFLLLCVAVALSAFKSVNKQLAKRVYYTQVVQRKSNANLPFLQNSIGWQLNREEINGGQRA